MSSAFQRQWRTRKLSHRSPIAREGQLIAKHSFDVETFNTPVEVVHMVSTFDLDAQGGHVANYPKSWFLNSLLHALNLCSSLLLPYVQENWSGVSHSTQAYTHSFSCDAVVSSLSAYKSSALTYIMQSIFLKSCCLMHGHLLHISRAHYIFYY